MTSHVATRVIVTNIQYLHLVTYIVLMTSHIDTRVIVTNIYSIYI